MLFVEQVQADYTDRFPVRPLQSDLVICINKGASFSFQYINAVRAWMDEQEEQRLARLEDARQQRFKEYVCFCTERTKPR